jgi:hypothetical protein
MEPIKNTYQEIVSEITAPQKPRGTGKYRRMLFLLVIFLFLGLGVYKILP